MLFAESKRFEPYLYNNLKGRIVAIYKDENKVVFDVEIDTVILEFGLTCAEIEVLEQLHPDKSVVRFSVFIRKTDDAEESDIDEAYVVPFQVAYAVSIHKAQGLEYNAVKVVITDDACSLISHDVFYTAITRAKNYLKIYSNAETMHKLVSSFKIKNQRRDMHLLENFMSI